MGNAELRLTLQSIESELAGNTTISLETQVQAKKTNGTVMWHTKMIWLAMGAIPLLTVWAAWLTKEQLDASRHTTIDQTAQVEAAVTKALDNYSPKVTR